MAFKKMRVADSIADGRSKTMHAAIAKELGQAIRLFRTSPGSSPSCLSTSTSNTDEPDDFYDLTPEDYYNIMSSQRRSQGQVLKTRVIREAEGRARRANITRATIHVQFPDGYALEAEFHASDKIQSLVELLVKAIARPELPFYLYTTPPKERVKDLSKDFYSAGFVPGAIVHFAYDLPTVADANCCPYLRSEVLLLNRLHCIDQAVSVEPEREPAREKINPAAPELKTAIKKTTKPKWLKL